MNQPGENPYSPPESEVRDTEDTLHRSLVWKAFFALMVLVFVLSIVITLIAPEATRPTWPDYVNTIVYGFALVGLFGFCFLKTILWPQVWRVFTPGLVAWDAWYLTTDEETWQNFTDSNASLVVFTVAITLLVVVPLYVALFRYAFGERRLWASGSARNLETA